MVSDAEYAKKHQLKELFEHLMKKVLERKPTDPEILMLNILKRRQDMKQKNPVRLLLFWIKPMKKLFMINLKKHFRPLTLVFEEVRKLSPSPAQALISPDLALPSPRFQNLAQPITIDPGCLPQKISQKLSLIRILRDLTVARLWLEQWT